MSEFPAMNVRLLILNHDSCNLNSKLRRRKKLLCSDFHQTGYIRSFDRAHKFLFEMFNTKNTQIRRYFCNARKTGCNLTVSKHISKQFANTFIGVIRVDDNCFYNPQKLYFQRIWFLYKIWDCTCDTGHRIHWWYSRQYSIDCTCETGHRIHWK